MTNNLAFYARYSSDQQKETSIEDQLRRCRETALQLNLEVENVLIFTDEAMSGTAKHRHKRAGYEALLTAWDDNRFSVLIVDEFSRMTRDGVEQAMLVKRLETNRRVRLVTHNGIDTSRPHWQLQVGLVGLVGQQEIRDTQDRVERGMVGQLERGFMIASPAYGYDIQRELDNRGNHLGTHWKIIKAEAEIVREIFRRRETGQSMNQIASWLNDTGVVCRRKATTPEGGYWRPSRVRNLLLNRIYRGEFVWHGSTTYHAQAKKQGTSVEEKAYPRPQLRLVSDGTWFRCNSKMGKRACYGGGKNALAGLVTCGCCGGTLVVSAKQPCPSMYCASCSIAKNTAGQADRLSVTVAVTGVQLLLTQALRHFLTPVFIEAFRSSLREKLTGDTTRQREACALELAKLQRAQDRISHMIASSDGDDPVLAIRYSETLSRVREARTRLAEFEAGKLRVDREAIEAQLQVDPAMLLDGLFDANLPPERLRMVLARLFPSLVLEGKEGRYRSIFRIRFAPGEALSLASDTEAVELGGVEARFQLRYTPDYHSGRTENRWSVIPLEGKTVASALTASCRSTATTTASCAV